MINTSNKENIFISCLNILNKLIHHLIRKECLFSLNKHCFKIESINCARAIMIHCGGWIEMDYKENTNKRMIELY